MGILNRKEIIYLREFQWKILGRFGYFPIRVRELEFVWKNMTLGAHQVLDVGCCESLLPIRLARAGYQVTGLDIRDYPFKHPNLTFITGDITDPELFQGGSGLFDLIICLSTVEHIGLGFYGDQKGEAGDKKAMRHMARLLKDSGKLILTVPFSGQYQVSSYQRIYDFSHLSDLIAGEWQIEEESYWIPLSKKNWVLAENRSEAEKVHPGFPESNNACLLLSKVRG